MDARCASLALIISYLTSASGIIVLLKTLTKYREFFPTLSVKTIDFQLVFHIWRAWYRVFSLTWPASMQIYWNKRKRFHEKRVQLPQDWFGTPTWPLFHCFGTPIWPPWRHVKTLYSGSYTITTKPIRALELHYPQIQFLIKWDSRVNRRWFESYSPTWSKMVTSTASYIIKQRFIYEFI